MTRRHLRRARHSLFSPKAWKTRLVFWSGAVMVGIAAVLLALGSDHANEQFQRLTEFSRYLPLLVCPLGFALIGWLTVRYFPGAQGSGIPQAMAALDMSEHTQRASVLSLRIACAKGVMILLGLLSGASIGREGPTVHIGAAIMFVLGERAHFPKHDIERGLILAGGAAGIGAAFNAPLAGVVFAIEEMSRSFEERTSGTVLTAVIIAGMTAMALLGNYTYLGKATPVDWGPASAWLAALLCGLVGGLLGGAFSALLIWGNRRLRPLRQAHPALLPAVCGLAVACIGLGAAGLTYGTGYQQARQILGGEGVGHIGFPYLKMLATMVSYWSGIPGGIFAPSLAIGAGIGEQLAMLLAGFPAEGVALLAMAAYFTGVLQTPITAFVIVSEMTDDHAFILPLMAASFAAYGVSRLLCPEPLYRVLAEEFLHGPGDGTGTGTRPSPASPARSK